MCAFAGRFREICEAELLIAMQKVEGSNPFSRFRKACICRSFCFGQSGSASASADNDWTIVPLADLASGPRVLLCSRFLATSTLDLLRPRAAERESTAPGWCSCATVTRLVDSGAGNLGGVRAAGAGSATVATRSPPDRSGMASARVGSLSRRLMRDGRGLLAPTPKVASARERARRDPRTRPRCGRGSEAETGPRRTPASVCQRASW